MSDPRGISLATVRDDQGLVEVIENADSRTLYFGSRARQSCMLLHDPLALPLGYTRCMLSALLFCPQPQRILLIGLGGGSQVRFLLHHFPDCRIDCIEARPVVAEVAQRYFDLPDDARLNIAINDGADYLKDCPPRRYDLILVDAYDGVGIHDSVCTAAFYRDCRAVLRSGGVLSVNLWVTPPAPYRDILANIEAAFSKQTLQLPVERHANLVVLGLERGCSPTDLKALADPARRLQDRLGLDFPHYLRRLRQHNISLLRRLFDLRRTSRH